MIVKRDRRDILEHRREELLHRIVEADHEIASHHNPDWEDLAVEREGDEVLETMTETDRTEIRAIDAALARMVQGEYGICVDCGVTISDARLDLLPATPFCKSCAPKHG